MSSDIPFKEPLIHIDILILDLHSKTSATGVIKYLADGKVNNSMDNEISNCYMCQSGFQDDFGNISFAHKMTPSSALKKTFCQIIIIMTFYIEMAFVLLFAIRNIIKSFQA